MYRRVAERKFFFPFPPFILSLVFYLFFHFFFLTLREKMKMKTKAERRNTLAPIHSLSSPAPVVSSFLFFSALYRFSSPRNSS
jgi:Na+/H+ antiporter NhaC